MIYDCFLYAGETDLLELRLAELAGVVDYHVIMENDYGFQGARRADRPLATGDNVINVHVSELLPYGSWPAEAYCRNALVRGLNRATLDDLVLISDVDEIPKPSAVERAAADSRLFEDVVAVLKGTTYLYALDWRVGFPKDLWPVALRKATLDAITPQRARYIKAHVIEGFPGVVYQDSCWEFAKLGHDGEALAAHLRSGGHDEFNHLTPEYLDRCIREGKHFLDGTTPLEPVEIDETWPRYVYANLGRWQPWMRAR